ncbi:MAG TPA: 50S ribosomal protein L22 [Candidatus Paceibacterota bacterium]|nr:50S ribosomal protein L22 [Candidatus Paceibacterota bacterium]
MATVSAQLNNLRLAPRKVRSVVGLIKGKNVLIAIDQLEYLIRRPSDPIIKLLKSAVANAENNFSMVPSNLFIKDFFVDEGIKLKRYRAAGFGRAREIQKKTSHVRLILAEKVAGLKAEKKAEKKQDHSHDHAHHDHEHQAASKQEKTDKPEIKTEIGKKSGAGRGGLKRIFQRKSI